MTKTFFPQCMTFCSFSSLKLWGSLVKFSHSIFALPFALSMAVYVASYRNVNVWQYVLIILAMISARNAAMTFNRIVDKNFDGLNPRTCLRELPAGKLSLGSAYFFLTLNSLLFLLAAALLGWHALILAPLVLGVLFGYSLAKRFTAYSHYILGLSLALAPGGVWYALTAEFAWLPIPFMLGVLFWVAGFDILYACQDKDFDVANKLHSWPAKFGNERSFLIARFSHVLAILAFVFFGQQAELGSYYFVGLLLFAGLLVSQQLLVSPQNLAKLDIAFFSRNGMASCVFFVFMCLDVWL